MNVMLLLIIVFGVSLALTAALVATRDHHLRFTGDCGNSGPHKVHAGVVPRIGGVAVFIAGLVGLALGTPGMQPQWALVIWSFWACLSLIFAIGVAEDLTRAVPVAIRYAAVFTAVALLSIALGGFGIRSVDIQLIDVLLSNPVAATLFFAFCVAGLVHAFNLIDGQNGLCAGFSVLVFCGIGSACLISGHAELGMLSLVMAAANVGFLVFNFPFGAIFIGDSGAYFNGAAAAALSILFVGYTLNVSPWFAVALFIYPVWDTFFTMLRRVCAGRPFYGGDRDHLHHRLRRFADIRAPGLSSISAMGVIAIATPSVVLAVLFRENTPALIIVASVFTLVFSAIQLALGHQGVAEKGYPTSAAHLVDVRLCEADGFADGRRREGG